MKNKIKFTLAALCGAFCVLLGSVTAFAAGNLSIAVSKNTVAAGDTMTVTVYAVNGNNEAVTSDMTITYDASKLEFVSGTGSANGGGGTVKVSGSNVDVKFKAIGSGDAYVKAEGASLTAAGAHINVSGTSAQPTASASEMTNDTANQSGDNSLSSLTLSSGTLSPAFQGNVTKCSAPVGSDVTDLTLNPVPATGKATVESITGNTGLKTGENTLSVTVKAENGATAVYTIVVTKTEGASQPSQTDTTQETSTANDSSQTVTTGIEATGDEAIEYEGETYHIADEFPDSVIPEDFKRSHFEYHGTQHTGVVYVNGHLGMYYLVNSAGEGRFFIYDADRDEFFPYVRWNGADSYIIVMVTPNGAVPPDKYEKTYLTLKDGLRIPVFCYTGGEEQEIQNFTGIESAQGEQAERAGTIENGMSDYCLVYAMNKDGVATWYQFDSLQGTYQRFNAEALTTTDPQDNYEVLLESYNSLTARNRKMKTRDRIVIAGLIFVVAVLIIVIINLLLRGRNDDDDDDFFEDISKKERPKKERSKKESSKKESYTEEWEEEEKPKKTFFAKRRMEDEEEDDFANDDFFDDFMEEPSMKKKKEHHKKGTDRKYHKEHEDDDFEFIDLNDL